MASFISPLSFQLPRYAEVSWRPPQTRLHYHELYCGIYEYLRAPPDREHRADAIRYLLNLQHSSATLALIPSARRLQDHRICWVLEWLRAMPEDADSDADTVEHTEQL